MSFEFSVVFVPLKISDDRTGFVPDGREKFALLLGGIIRFKHLVLSGVGAGEKGFDLAAGILPVAAEDAVSDRYPAVITFSAFLFI